MCQLKHISFGESLTGILEEIRNFLIKENYRSEKITLYSENDKKIIDVLIFMSMLGITFNDSNVALNIIGSKEFDIEFEINFTRGIMTTDNEKLIYNLCKLLYDYYIKKSPKNELLKCIIATDIETKRSESL